MKQKNLLKTLFLLFALIVGSSSVWAEDVTYTFTSKSWGATSGGNTADWISGKDGANFNTQGVQVTTNYTGANATSPIEFTNVSKIVVTYNTNKSAGAGSVAIQIGSNAATTNNVAYSGSGDGREANYTTEFNYTTPQTGKVKITVNTTTNSIYIKSIAITYTSGGGAPTAVATTTIIDDTDITNTDVYVGTAAGSLSAIVLDENDDEISGASVTWSGNNDEVATIDETTGEVTLVAAGTVTFTATYAGLQDAYFASYDTYEMTVTSSAPYVQPTEFDIALNNTFFGTNYEGSASGITDDNPVSASKDNVTVTYAGSGNHYINNSQIRFYPNNKLTFEAPTGYNITQIVFTSAGTWAATISSDEGVYNSDTKTWNGVASTVLFTGSGSSRCDISKVTITIEAIGTDPSITASNVNIAYDATGGSIAYTINNPANGTLTASVPSNSWVTLGNDFTSPIAFTCTANPNTTARTETVTLTYTYGNESVTKDVTITQAAAPVSYTTIPALFEAATSAGSTATNVNVTFGNWVVSGVSGSNVFVTDNSGNGFIIYTSNHGFAVNDKLSGTVINTPLKLFSGSAEFTNLPANTSGLTVSQDGEITVVTNKSIADLAGVNTGAVIKLSNLTYDGTNLSDGTNTIKPYNSLYSDLSLTSGKTYNITGVYQQFNSTKEVLPRSAADIEEVVITEPTITVDPTTVDAPAEGIYDGEIEVTYNNLSNVDAEVKFYESDGTTEATYDWIITDFDNENNVEYLIDPNDGDARTAYMKVYAVGDEGDAYSELITINQAAYAAPAEDGDYIRITSLDQLTDGSKVVIAARYGKNATAYYAMQNSTSGKPEGEMFEAKTTTDGQALPVEITDNEDDYYWTVNVSENGFTFTNANGQVLGYTSSTNFATGGSNTEWTIESSTSEPTAMVGEYEGFVIKNYNIDTRCVALNSSHNFGPYATSNMNNNGYNFFLDIFQSATPTEVTATISASGYTTLSSAYPLDFSGTITNLTAAYVVSALSATKATFTEVETAVPAETGLVLEGTPGATVTIPVATTTPEAPEKNFLKACVNGGTVTASSVYAMSGGQFKLYTGTELPAGKAYLLKSDVDAAGGSGAPLSFDFGGTTGISTVDNGQQTTDNRWYDLSGRRVENPTKGMYIHNGKKVVIK